ncbi:MAG: DUF533 domain-containing protein [Pirellulaceae bacterium]
MDAIDILGSLLGGGSRGAQKPGGGLGGAILDKLIKSGGRSSQPTPAPGGRGGAGSGHRPIDIEQESRSLEEMLGVATGKKCQDGPSSTQRPSSYRRAPDPPRYQPNPPSRRPAPSAPQMTSNDEAIILIRALINAAKADGRIDANEQQTILSQVPNDPQTIEFLKHEFAQAIDVRDFAWSVPLGMEVKVYTMSLAGMQLDTQQEAHYLQELAHGLRLEPDLCNQIHVRYGAQPIFR